MLSHGFSLVAEGLVPVDARTLKLAPIANARSGPWPWLGWALVYARLDGNSVRAIDFHEGDAVDEAALKALLLEAVRPIRCAGSRLL
jgi:hypothetical protein